MQRKVLSVPIAERTYFHLNGRLTRTAAVLTTFCVDYIKATALKYNPEITQHDIYSVNIGLYNAILQIHQYVKAPRLNYRPPSV